MGVSSLNTPDFGPRSTVWDLNLAPQLGLIVFTVLTSAISIYLIYTMLRPTAF